jgi:hypothetical protein
MRRMNDEIALLLVGENRKMARPDQAIRYWQWFIATLTLALAACGGGARIVQEPPVISAFTASPTDAVTGRRITLSWTVAGATDLSISGLGAVTGSSTDVHPTTDTDYVLTAKNAAGTATQHVQVTIYPPPVNWFAPFPTTPQGTLACSISCSVRCRCALGRCCGTLQVFKMYEQIMAFPDASLRTMFADRVTGTSPWRSNSARSSSARVVAAGIRPDRGLQLPNASATEVSSTSP